MKKKQKINLLTDTIAELQNGLNNAITHIEKQEVLIAELKAKDFERREQKKAIQELRELCEYVDTVLIEDIIAIIKPF